MQTAYILRADMEYTNSRMTFLIDEHIHNKKHREILKMCYIDGVPQMEIADIMKMSPKQIYNIISKNTLILSKLL